MVGVWWVNGGCLVGGWWVELGNGYWRLMMIEAMDFAFERNDCIAANSASCSLSDGSRRWLLMMASICPLV